MLYLTRQSFELFNPRPAAEAYLAIETAARTSHRSEGDAEKREDFIRGLMRKGHDSVLEHVSVSARITTDRGVMAELTRHRLASFTVESTRYVSYGDPESFYVVSEGAEQYAAWISAMEEASRAYERLRAAGMAPEEARAVLPMSLATRIFMTANVREWRHVMRLRTSPAAHPMMRDLMLDGLAKLKALYPVLFEDIQP